MDPHELSATLKELTKAVQEIGTSVSNLETKYSFVERDFRERISTLVQEMSVLAGMVRNGIRDRLREVERQAESHANEFGKVWNEIAKFKQAIAEHGDVELKLKIEKTRGFWVLAAAVVTGLATGIFSILLQILK